MLESILFSLLHLFQMITDDSPKLCKIEWYQHLELIGETGYVYKSHTEATVAAESLKNGDESITISVVCDYERNLT